MCEGINCLAGVKVGSELVVDDSMWTPRRSFFLPSTRKIKQDKLSIFQGRVETV
jgi:hypothetical protein